MWLSFYIVMQQNIKKQVNVFVVGNELLSWLTNSMEHSPSWEANRSSASQEIPHILWS